MSKTVKKTIALLVICLISAAILSITFATHRFAYQAICELSLDAPAQNRARSTEYELIYGISGLVWFLALLPLPSFFYSKKYIADDPEKHIMTLIYSAALSAVYIAAALLICAFFTLLNYRSGEGLLGIGLIFLWSFLFCGLGLIRRRQAQMLDRSAE